MPEIIRSLAPDAANTNVLGTDLKLVLKYVLYGSIQ